MNSEPGSHPDDAVILWRFFWKDGQNHFEEYQKLLTPEEEERAKQFLFQYDQLKYTLSKAFLRLLLSRLLKRPPQDIKIGYNGFGKPLLAKERLYFNLSYTESTLYIATTKLCSIGVDVEKIMPSTESHALFQKLYPQFADQSAEPERDFVSLWTQTEAFLKAWGVGFHSNAIPYHILGIQPPLDTWSRFFYCFQPEPGYMGAIALVEPLAPRVIFDELHILEPVS